MSTKPARIGIVGDRNPNNITHIKTESALSDFGVAFDWVPTGSLRPDTAATLAPFTGLLIAPGSPYADMEGALAAIRYAREQGVPLLGACGGFQHIALEFVRNVLGIAEADHAETAEGAERLAVTPLVCSLAGQSHPVRPLPGSRAAAIYGVESSIEPFFCRYGVNPLYVPQLEAKGLKVAGVSEDGEVRLMELTGHPFFIGALFVPQVASTKDAPHPLVAAFVMAAGG